MSEHGFHVHGPHDHEVEHAAAHDRDPFAARIAVMTAIFATIGAFFGYMAGATQNDALLRKNDSAIRRTEASDQWNFYQAKSSKQNLAELGSVLASGDAAARFKAEAERYNREKQEIMVKAQELEKRSAELETQSEASMHVHHRWAQSLTLIQIAIALAAITLLTRRRWLQWMAHGAGAASVVIGVLAFVHL
jgi:Na+/glutamate symporter